MNTKIKTSLTITKTISSIFIYLVSLLLACNSFAQSGMPDHYYLPPINELLLSEDDNNQNSDPELEQGSIDFSDVDNWSLSASTNQDLGLALDGDATTRWTTRQTQRSGQFYEINFNSIKLFDRILLDTTGNNSDYPRDYEVQVSNDGINFASIAIGTPSNNPLTLISFPAQSSRYLRIEQNGSANRNWWSIHEVTIAFGEIPDEPVEPTPPDDDPDGLHPDITRVADIPPEDILREPRGEAWKDSYSVGDRCYCDTTFDHNIGSIRVDTAIGNISVTEACEAIGPGPGSNGRPIYNDVQCGNGPANDAGDEDYCPGRVDIGKEGCPQIGPRWNFN